MADFARLAAAMNFSRPRIRFDCDTPPDNQRPAARDERDEFAIAGPARHSNPCCTSAMPPASLDRRDQAVD